MQCHRIMTANNHIHCICTHWPKRQFKFALSLIKDTHLCKLVPWDGSIGIPSIRIDSVQFWLVNENWILVWTFVNWPRFGIEVYISYLNVAMMQQIFSQRLIKWPIFIWQNVSKSNLVLYRLFLICQKQVETS